MNNSTNEKVKNNDGKGIAIISVGILTIIFAIAGATFAFFQVNATASGISGDSAYSSSPLTLTVEDVTANTVGSKKLIPQVDKDIQTAVTGSTNGSCVDKNGSAVCKVYSISVTNNTGANYYLNGTLTFNTTPATTATAGMPNLKWARGSSATDGFPTSNSGPFYSTFDTFTSNTTSTTQTTALANTFFLPSTQSQTFYVVVWISETGSVQTDSGKFTGIVSFTGYSDEDGSIQGVTSTIRSEIAD